MNQPLAVGIDIGGTNTAFGIVDHKGTILEHGTISTKKHKDIDVYMDTLHKNLLPLIQKVKGDIKGIGVGAPNGNFYNGNIEFAPNLPWEGIIPLGKMINERFDIPVQVTNDANAAAEGEFIFGAAKGMNHFIMITLGTGLGSGIVIDGKLVYGYDGFAGELGHVIVKTEGRRCGCGRRGCLERYVSATGIVYTMHEILDRDKNTDSILRSIPPKKLNSKDISEAAAKGDRMALEAIDYTARIFGEALSNFVAFSAPEAIILFGGLARAGDLIIDPTERYMNENVLQIWKNKVKVLSSELNEDDAAILGASALVWEIEGGH